MTPLPQGRGSVATASSLRLTVYGAPQPAGSKTAGRSSSGKLFVRDASKGSAPWKRQVAQAAGEAMNGRDLMEGPLLLLAKFYVTRPAGHYGANGLRASAPAYPVKRPDTTKLLRAVEDAMTGIVWRDDAQVVVQQASKLFGEPARCELHVEIIGETPATQRNRR